MTGDGGNNLGEEAFVDAATTPTHVCWCVQSAISSSANHNDMSPHDLDKLRSQPSIFPKCRHHVPVGSASELPVLVKLGELPRRMDMNFC